MSIFHFITEIMIMETAAIIRDAETLVRVFSHSKQVHFQTQSMWIQSLKFLTNVLFSFFFEPGFLLL